MSSRHPHLFILSQCIWFTSVCTYILLVCCVTVCVNNLTVLSESLSPIQQPIMYMRYMLNWIHPFFKIHTVVMNIIMHLPGMCVLSLVAITWIECMYKGRLHLVYRYFCQVRPQDTAWSVSYSYKGNSCKHILVVVWNSFLEHFLSITSLIQLLVFQFTLRLNYGIYGSFTVTTHGGDHHSFPLG